MLVVGAMVEQGLDDKAVVDAENQGGGHVGPGKFFQHDHVGVGVQPAAIQFFGHQRGPEALVHGFFQQIAGGSSV